MVDREGIVVQDVLNSGSFCVVIIQLQVIGVQSVVKVPHCGVFVLGGVVRGVRDGSVCECWFSVYSDSPVCRGPMDGDVKLKSNNAMIARADEGNSLVILDTEQYDTKVQNFIHSNKFETAPRDPT